MPILPSGIYSELSARSTACSDCGTPGQNETYCGSVAKLASKLPEKLLSCGVALSLDGGRPSSSVAVGPSFCIRHNSPLATLPTLSRDQSPSKIGLASVKKR